MNPFIDGLGGALVTLLAILGGAFIGSIATGLLLATGARYFGKRKIPGPIMQVARGAGGVAVAVLIYFLVAVGGSGFGLGGLGFSLGPGNERNTGHEKKDGKDTAQTKKTPTNQETKKESPPEMLRIEMLGGKRYVDKSNRFYLVDGENQARNIGEVDSIIQTRQKQPGFPGIEIVIYRTGSVAASHAAVKDLVNRARGRGLAVKTTTLEQDAPPLKSKE